MLSTIIAALLLISSSSSYPFNGTLEKIPVKNLADRIVNGQEAKEGQFPWQVQLVANQVTQLSLCGGALISDQWVLTAAHCADGASSFTLYFGSITFNEGTPAATRTGFLHELYNRFATGLNFDVAVIKLTFPLTFNARIQPIEISTKVLEPGVKVTASGWGRIGDHAESGSTTLNYVELESISLDECRRVYGSLYEGFVCTKSGEVKNGVCKGDSGGPLVANVDTHPLHVGIVCFSADNSCEAGYPSGYTQTGYFADWIRDKTGI